MASLTPLQVTGATDGIGRGFAESLLERGFNVLLHGRNPEKLERVRAELAAAFPTRQLATVIADASAPDDSYQKVATAAQSLPGGGKLTVLINNVGGVPFARGIAPHSTLDAATVDGILHLNARFPTQLTRALLPTLSAHAPALVLSCSSLAGLQAMPYLAVYGSTKAYIDGFTRGLRADQAAARVLAAAGDKSAPVPAADVEVVGAWIGNVLSGGNKTDVPFFTMTSKQCADACLGRVGSGHALTFPSWRVAMMLALTQVLPQKMQDDITTKSMQERYLSQEKNV